MYQGSALPPQWSSFPLPQRVRLQIAQATAEHKELQQLCAREDATMARMRQWMERAHKAFSATEARNGQLRAELSRLKGMAPK